MTALISAEAAVAQAVVSIDTELVKGRCKFIADDGEVGDYALKRCPGLAGARVLTTAEVSHVTLAFQWGKTKVDAVSSYSVGDKLEWRGIGSRQNFKPYATLVRIIVRDHDSMDNEGNYKTYNVWGIIRMEPRNACLIAVVDAAANPDALRLARETADKEAPGLSCSDAKARIVGNPSRWAQEAIGIEGDPPK